MNIELLINGSKGVFAPVVCGEIMCCSKKWGAGYLKFSVLKEGSIDFKEGDAVSLRVDSKDMFYGYVFTKERNKKGVISVLCYDQMRYLKNKDTYVFSAKTASQIFMMIANDYKIKTGTVDNTGLVLQPRIEDNTTLMDIMYTALNVTESRGYGNFIIYDDFGKLCLKNTKNMNSNLIIDMATAIDFDYKTTIDKGVYNKVKLLYKRETKYTNTMNVYVAQDDKSIKEWGVLQYFSHIDINETDGNVKARELLNIHKTKNRNLQITTIGNLNMRAGWKVHVDLDIGDFVINDSMRIRECCHIFGGNKHHMVLDMEGGVLVE